MNLIMYSKRPTKRFSFDGEKNSPGAGGACKCSKTKWRNPSGEDVRSNYYVKFRARAISQRRSEPTPPAARKLCGVGYERLAATHGLEGYGREAGGHKAEGQDE